MSELQEKIGKLCPSAQIDDSGEFLLITVPDEHWHNLATSLKDELHFDYLTALVGVDWKEELGVMYYLTNTETQEMIHIKVATSDREQPRLHSVSDLWAVANYQEREVFDFYGIEFINHPDMRRFFLRSDWVGYPLRKDYDESPEKNPLRLDDEPAEDETYRLVEDEQVMLLVSMVRSLRTMSMSSMWDHSILLLTALCAIVHLSKVSW